MAVRLKEPKPLKPLRPIRWRRETTASESEFAVRKIWTSRAGVFQIVECVYKHPYTYPRRFLALHWNGEAFVPISNGHKKRPYARRACEVHNRKLYAAGQVRYEEQKKRYEQAVARQAERDKARRKADAQAARRAAKAGAGALHPSATKRGAAAEAPAPSNVKTAAVRHSSKATAVSGKPARTKRGKR